MSDELLTQEEHEIIHLCAQIWNKCSKVYGRSEDTWYADAQELAFHIHGIQHAIMGQAAARAYPDRYRLLGSTIEEVSNGLGRANGPESSSPPLV